MVPFFVVHVHCNSDDDITAATFSGVIIAVGSRCSILGGFLSEKYDSAVVAMALATSSGFCCLIINTEFFGVKVTVLAI